MARPITLFTGQWADLPLAELAPLARRMGYDGLELACRGDHFDVQQALALRELADTARAARAFGVKTVTGFTGPSIWHATCAFPPTTQAFRDAGFARRFGFNFDKARQGGMAGSTP